jgi:GNAT superfamily N-acetyltransferase
VTFEIREGYEPGVVGRLTELHATYYGGLWELGPRFEREMAEGIAEFVTRYDDRDGLWTVVDPDGTVMGGIVIDGRNAGAEGAQLRYFLLDPVVHGNGLGRALLEEAMGFCRRKRFDRVFLWTVEELAAAVHLYRDVGFEPTGEVDVYSGWRTAVPYRRYECDLRGPTG